MSDAAAGTTGAAAQAAAAAAAPGAPAGTDAAAAGGAAPSPADAAAAAASTAAAAQAGTDAAANDAAVDTTGWPAEAVAAYTTARNKQLEYQREAQSQRTTAKANAAAEARTALLTELNKVINPDANDATPTVEGLTTEIQAAKGELGNAAKTNMVTLAAWQEGVAPAAQELLEFKLSRSAEFKAIDPTDADASTKVRAIVTAMLVADPTLKASVGPVATGVETLAGGNSTTAITPEAWAKMSQAEKGEIYRTDQATYNRLAGNAS